MTVKCGFFNSVGGDRLYNADDLSYYYKGLVADGILANYGNGLMVAANNGMNVRVGKGRAYIDGKYVELDASEVLDLEQSSTNLNRIDAIVLRKDNQSRDITLYVKKGELAAVPAEPVMERSGSATELCLAMVRVNRLASEILTENITDTRMDSERCGYVTGLVDFLDTSQLFRQWTAAFDNWFGGLVETLGVNTKNVRTVASYYSMKDVVRVELPESLHYVPGDILQIYMNGILMEPEREYTIGENAVELKNGMDMGNRLIFVCIKSTVSTD